MKTILAAFLLGPLTLLAAPPTPTTPSSKAPVVKGISATAPAPAPEPTTRVEDTGSIEKLEVTAITRERISCWARTILPKIAKGSKQTFTGEVAIANVPIPVRTPVTVLVQERPGGRNEAVFFLDLDLAKTPEDLLRKASTHAADLTLKGQITGEKGTSARVCAVGLLRYGTSDVYAPAGNAQAFVTFSGAKLTGLSLSTISGEGTIALFNPFGFDIGVKDISYTLYAGDRKLGGGGRSGVLLHAGRESTVTLPIEAKNSDVVAAAGKAVSGGGTIDGRLVASISFKVGKDVITVPVTLPGKIKLVK